MVTTHTSKMETKQQLSGPLGIVVFVIFWADRTITWDATMLAMSTETSNDSLALSPARIPFISLRMRHYWRRPLCRGPEALGKGPLTLGKGFAEGGPRQRALGEFWVGEEGLCRGPFIGHSAKPLPRAGAALGKEKQPSRRRCLEWSLCRGPSPGALGKELFFF